MVVSNNQAKAAAEATTITGAVETTLSLPAAPTTTREAEVTVVAEDTTTNEAAVAKVVSPVKSPSQTLDQASLADWSLTTSSSRFATRALSTSTP